MRVRASCFLLAALRATPTAAPSSEPRDAERNVGASLSLALAPSLTRSLTRTADGAAQATPPPRVRVLPPPDGVQPVPHCRDIQGCSGAGSRRRWSLTGSKARWSCVRTTMSTWTARAAIGAARRVCQRQAPPSGQGCTYRLELTSPVLTNETLHRWLCPAQPVPCTQSSRGCAVIVPRSELEAHLATCPFEALSPYFAAMDVRFAAIERKYDELRTENEGLRSQLWNMRRGMVIPRSLWGDDSAATMSLASDPPSPTTVPVSVPPPSPLTTPFTASSIPVGPRQVVDTDPEATPTVTTEPFPDPHPSPRSRPTTLMPAPPMPDLAPSPMSLSPVTPPTPSTSTSPAPQPRDPHAFPSRSTLLSPPPRTSYTDWVLERLPPPSHYHDDGCTALRQAVIHLAAGLDACERRSEMCASRPHLCPTHYSIHN